MLRMRAFVLTAALVPALAACVSSGSGVPTRPGQTTKRPTPPVRQPVRRPPPAAQVQTLPGVQGVIGATRADLTRQFGTARLDVWEGDARKLQFVGPACVLDIYLYPSQEGREPQATYVDARRATDGQDVDRAACIAALRRR